jgi:NADPH2 dehydrogenase
VHGFSDIEVPETENLDFAFGLWDGPILLAGGHRAGSARRLVDEKRRDRDVVVVFGWYFISNPGLPFRVREGLEFAPYRRDLFYTPASLEEGYTDYPFSPAFLSESPAVQA